MLDPGTCRQSYRANVAHRDERLKQYAELCRRKNAHPLFLQQYSQELRMDGGATRKRSGCSPCAIRRWASHAANYYILGNIYWDRRRFEEALELYRFAACLDDKDEQFVRAYFIAAKWFKRTDEVLDWLRNRFERFGRKSNSPARDSILFAMPTRSAFGSLGGPRTRLSEMRPDDGQLQLFAADGYLSCGMHNLSAAENT